MPQPVQRRIANQDFRTGAHFVKEYSRFERALSGANDQDLLVPELAEVPLL